MNLSNQLWGIITIILDASLFWFAYLTAKKENYSLSISLIFLAGLILRLFAGMDYFLHPWDETYHALVAKNLLNHMFVPTLFEHPVLNFDYKDWTANHIWVHKPPLSLWLIMLSLKLFGINEIAVRLPSIILSSIGIFLTYYIAKQFYNEKVGLLASFFYAINGVLIELATGRNPTDHPEILFVFFIELGIFLSVYYLKHRSLLVIILIGLATGCALLTKWLPGLIIIGVLFILLTYHESWKQAMIKCSVALLVAAALALPWQIYIFSAFPREAAWESYFNYRHIIEPLEGHTGSLFFHFILFPRIFGQLAPIALIMFFYTFYNKKYSIATIALTFWFLLPYLFFTYVATKMQGYVMMSSPAIFIIIAWAFWLVKDNLKNSSYRIWKIIFLILLIALPVRTLIERIKPFTKTDRSELWAVRLRELNLQIPQSNAVVFNVQHNIEAMFYCNFTAYPFIPSNDQILQSILKGYSVYIIDSPSIPAEIRNNNKITFLKN
ncbi:MAG: glycosyltransferase family 39 protein [Ignavibacteriaceae bacterium]|nr:glycosyltransferase family 39 protein [Ignavibacteriaceae bacterium]